MLNNVKYIDILVFLLVIIDMIDFLNWKKCNCIIFNC